FCTLPVVTDTDTVWPTFAPVGILSMPIVTPYVTTLLEVVADGSIAVTLPVASAPDSAFQVTWAICFSLSLVASASAKAALTWSLVRSSIAMNPDDEDEEDDEALDPPPLLPPPWLP